MQYLKDVADDRHSLGWLPSYAPALAGKEVPVLLSPVFQRAIAFSFDGRVLGADFVESDYFRAHDSCDQCRLVEMVNNDFDVSSLRDGLLIVFVGPEQAGPCTLAP